MDSETLVAICYRANRVLNEQTKHFNPDTICPAWHSLALMLTGVNAERQAFG
jgi:hypothetical protein